MVSTDGAVRLGGTKSSEQIAVSTCLRRFSVPVFQLPPSNTTWIPASLAHLAASMQRSRLCPSTSTSDTSSSIAGRKPLPCGEVVVAFVDTTVRDPVASDTAIEEIEGTKSSPARSTISTRSLLKSFNIIYEAAVCPLAEINRLLPPREAKAAAAFVAGPPAYIPCLRATIFLFSAG